MVSEMTKYPIAKHTLQAIEQMVLESHDKPFIEHTVGYSLFKQAELKRALLFNRLRSKRYVYEQKHLIY